jgi:tRNA nucleotidyltransferase (CCA-adding enzyme)
MSFGLHISMTEDQYIESILNKYSVTYGDYSPASRVLISLTPTLETWAGEYLNKIHFSGSYAKRTAINIGTDVDIFISISSSVPRTLDEIYNSLFKLSSSKGWNPRKRNVSIGITYQATKIDLVP